MAPRAFALLGVADWEVNGNHLELGCWAALSVSKRSNLLLVSWKATCLQRV